MRARVKVKAPWWTSLTGSELRATLEKTAKDDSAVGDTRYEVFVGDESAGFVYSVKDEKSTLWFVDGDGKGHGYADRFTAIRHLLSVREHSALSA